MVLVSAGALIASKALAATEEVVVLLLALVLLLELLDENISTLLLGTFVDRVRSVVLEALVGLLEVSDEGVTLLLVALSVSSVSSSVAGAEAEAKSLATIATIVAAAAVARLEATSVSLKTAKVVIKASLEATTLETNLVAAKDAALRATGYVTERSKLIIETTSASEAEVTLKRSSESIAEVSADVLETYVSSFEASCGDLLGESTNVNGTTDELSGAWDLAGTLSSELS